MPQYVGERTGLEDCDNLTIYGAAGSAAEKYAQEKDITFVEDESMQSTVIPDSEEEELETQEEVEMCIRDSECRAWFPLYESADGFQV